MVKLIDVARVAGVSPATASRALNGHPTVGVEYVDRVQAAAEQLGYRPNSVARNLRRQATDLVALIIPDVGNHFCTAVTRGVEDVAREAGLSVLLCNSDEDPAKEARYLDVAEAENVAGVLLCPHGPDADISRLLASGIPVVALDRRLGAEIDSVTTDSHQGSYDATLHLLREGWTRPGCCAGPRSVDTARWRTAGYLQAVHEAGCGARVAHGDYDREGGERAAAELLSAEDAPDSLLVANEQMALGVLAEVKRRGLVPGVDIGIVTFDDTPWASLIEPPMTVIEQPALEIGARSMRMLLDRVRAEGIAGAVHVELPTKLVVRESSRRHG